MSDEQRADGGAGQDTPRKADDARAPGADERARNKDRDQGRDKDREDRDREKGRDRDRDRDRDKDRDDAPGADGGKAEGGEGGGGDDDAEREREERERERERAAGRFKEHTRDPLAEEQGEDASTDLAAAARARRATRMLFDAGRDLHTFDRSYFHSAHIGDIHLRMDARRSGSALRSGPVPDEELRRLRRVHVEPEGYVRLREALLARRLLVLGAAPGTGRTSTALSLLDEVTGPAANGTQPRATARVQRVDPAGGVRQLADSLDAGDGDGGHGGSGGNGGGHDGVGGGEGGAGDDGTGPRSGYLLEFSLTRPGASVPDEMDLDGLAAALARRDAFAVVVVPVGSAADPLLAGRYGALCPPAPTGELLTTRLRERLEEHGTATGADGARADRLLTDAEALWNRPEVTDAVGLKDLRPVEAEVLASLLAGHLLGDLTYEQLLAGCRSLAARQAQEWFAGVDRALAAPAGEEPDRERPGAAGLFHPVAFRIALAVLGGASHSAVAAAAHLLTWELSVQSDPDRTPARPLFCDDPRSDLALSRAELRDGRVEVAGAEVPSRLIWYRGAALPAAVLSELWDRHFAVRTPVVRWLRLLADDPRSQVWMRAAVAAGELCVRDFDHGYAELIRPLADAATPRRRVFAATALDQAAGHDSHRRIVHKVVGDWSRYGTEPLRWTAAMALGYGNSAATTGDTLDALARIGVRDEGDQLAVASFNVVRLLALPDAAAVLRRVADWTHHKREIYQDLGLVTTVRLALTTVDEVLVDDAGSPLGDRGDWPLPLALAAARPELVRPMADLLWTALNTPRSKEVATDALESLLRSAVRGDGDEWTRPGLAALLPAVTTEEHDRRRLDWLLRRMMNDPEDPLPDAQARSLWWLAVATRDRTREEVRHG
ncbi:hypothetical protein [Streptomyces lancefieldiae]|uniref:Uncharacterized protein n=1 Tax=Streptomyces lancefieldiae TaxID=3075520 RepID=A0ABU3AI35_9ACTN|nr:hypothetical protein [Streptomyces sp. DSM 40712]MDT0609849.1 hypothetical protein [Streptomyces sp. DSM 40712]